MGRIRSALVVAGVFINQFLGNGFYKSMGLFIVEWKEEFDGTAEEIGWIGSFCLIGYALAGKLENNVKTLFFKSISIHCINNSFSSMVVY